MSALQYIVYSEEEKEEDGMIAISLIEETLADIIRRNCYPAEEVADQMIRFAKGYVEHYPASQTSRAIQTKIQAMFDNILNTTCLTKKEIKALIVMMNYF